MTEIERVHSAREMLNLIKDARDFTKEGYGLIRGIKGADTTGKWLAEVAVSRLEDAFTTADEFYRETLKDVENAKKRRRERGFK